MNITIHRGAHQIGGCITEISTDGAKIIIDLGSNLPGVGVDEMATDDAVIRITHDADAIFYTHYHGDHVGLFSRVPTHVTQYIGKGAKEVMIRKHEALRQTEEVAIIQGFKTYEANSSLNIKNKIIVTPFYVSHSAFDAYMFKIEVEGKTILHTGDFRTHGYMGSSLERVLRYHIKQVDILITEGTMLGRRNEAILSEADIENNVVTALRKNKYVYALCSSTDIDRLRALHNACKVTRRTFICDSYQCSVLEIFNKYTISGKYKFNRVFKYVNHKTKKVRDKLYHTGFLVLVRPSSMHRIKSMMRFYNDQTSILIYSMWQGYHNGTQEQINEDIVNIRKLFGGNIYDGTRDGFHTSGHASVDTLQMVCRCVKPRLGIIPIHKESHTSFKGLSISKDYRIIESSTQIDNINISLQ